MNIDTLTDKIVLLAKEYGAKTVILFGSILENPKEAHDIDIACDIPGLALLAFAGRLEEELKFPIDVLPLDLDSPFISYIKENGKVIYGQ